MGENVGTKVSGAASGRLGAPAVRVRTELGKRGIAMVKDILKELEKKMKVSTEHFRRELSKLRTGRANISIFEDIKVTYYGTLTPINQVATMGVPDPTLIVLQPWDPSVLEALEKAVRGSEYGFNSIDDGKVLKVPIPPLDEDRRREIAKRIGKMMEEEAEESGEYC